MSETGPRQATKETLPRVRKRVTIALAGNPNSGKTSIFNDLTGARQHVGNYPGVTVEKKEGSCKHGDVTMAVVDLPGTYSLSAYSVEELVARDFIIEEKPGKKVVKEHLEAIIAVECASSDED